MCLLVDFQGKNDTNFMPDNPIDTNGYNKGDIKKYWGFDSFRPKQEGIINDLINGEDVFALLPTGGGNHFVVSYPLMKKITIVISPLISLVNQVSQ